MEIHLKMFLSVRKHNLPYNLEGFQNKPNQAKRLDFYLKYSPSIRFLRYFLHSDRKSKLKYQPKSRPSLISSRFPSQVNLPRNSFIRSCFFSETICFSAAST